jgi:polyisoprenoid-binding protein YceI
VTRLLRGLALVTLVILAGCANPADDKPEAEVGTASHGDVQMAKGTEYTFLDESKIEFVGSKVTGQHHGGFTDFAGTFHVVDNDPTKSSVEITIDTGSLYVDNDRLAGHLKSPDFFDVAEYPEAMFQSTSIAKEGDIYKVTGNLHLHGVTKSITFPAAIALGNDQVVVNSEFVIKRFDFNINYKGKADDLIRDEVVIKLSMVGKAGSPS